MRVLITGCFDLIHPGHLYFMEQAAKFGEVYVIVARDSTISKFKQNPPVIPETQRLAVVQAIKFVKEAVLGNENNNYLQKALQLHPDLILLGPNQRISVNKLQIELEEHGAGHIKVKRIQEFNDDFDLNSSSKIKEKICKTCKK